MLNTGNGSLGLATMIRATAAAAVMAVVLSGCSLRNINDAFRTLPPTSTSTSSASGPNGFSTAPQSPTPLTSGPRSQLVTQLTMPPGSELAQRLDTYFENWAVDRNRDSVESYLAPQLPVFRDFDGRPWCKTVTTEFNGTKETKWVWGTADNGLMIFVTGITNSDNSRVLVVTGATAGKNATGCTR